MVHFFLYLLGSSLVVSQFLSLTSLDSGVSASFRGLSVVNNSVVWVSGTGGTVLRTIDNGENWKNVSVPEMENTDFRDIHGFNKNIAIVMGIDSPARFFKTIDGGKSWDLVHFDEREGVFYDGMSFWNRKNGIAFSDPVDGKHLIIKTQDGGESWQEILSTAIPKKLDKEFGFAASGTSMPVIGSKLVWLGMGGTKSRVFRSQNGGLDWTVSETPVVHGGQSTGIYSVSFKNSKVGVAVGGDYTNQSIKNTMAYTEDGGFTWHLPIEQTHQYRECVTYFRKNTFVAVGPSGFDISNDNGKHWKRLFSEVKDLTALSFSRGSNKGYAVGKKGMIVKLEIRD